MQSALESPYRIDRYQVISSSVFMTAGPPLSWRLDFGIGHFRLEVCLTKDDAPPCAGLAPLAVTPEVQGRGAGSALVRAGLRDCLALGWQAVFLLGNPAYYSRFGFDLAAPRGLRYESATFDAVFQMVELVPDTLSGCSGWVHYHEAFSEL